MLRMCVDTDLRTILPTVRVPTLVLHRRDDQYLRVTHGRYLAEHISGASYVELPGADHDPEVGDSEAIAAEIQEFLTGERSRVELDRILATVVFTDIVNSTRRAAALGDARWIELLNRLDAAVQRHAAYFRGTVVKSTGDGHLLIFDAPGRGIQWAQTVMEAARGMELEVRAGLHTGEVERRGNDIGGLAVHLAARVAALSGPGQILVSSTVRNLMAGSGIGFADCGEKVLKGIPGRWRILAVEE